MISVHLERSATKRQHSAPEYLERRKHSIAGLAMVISSYPISLSLYSLFDTDVLPNPKNGRTGRAAAARRADRVRSVRRSSAAASVATPPPPPPPSLLPPPPPPTPPTPPTPSANSVPSAALPSGTNLRLPSFTELDGCLVDYRVLDENDVVREWRRASVRESQRARDLDGAPTLTRFDWSNRSHRQTLPPCVHFFFFCYRVFTGFLFLFIATV